MATVTWTPKKAKEIKSDVVILAMFSSAKVDPKANQELESFLGKTAKADLKKLNFTAKPNQSIIIPAKNQAVLVVGLGETKDFTFDVLKRASATAAQKAADFKTATAAYGQTAASVLDAKDVATAMYEGLALGSYSFSRFKDSNKKELTKITISEVTNKTTTAAFSRASKVVEGVIWARDAINTPPNDKAPKDFANNIKNLLKDTGIKVEILDVAGLKRNKMAGVLAVGQGSANEPRFVRLSYKSPGAKKKLAFVGKGVIFDSGGLSIKPGDAMTTMKCDMSGAAAVAGAFKAISKLKPKINIEGFIPMVENMPSGTAYRVDDVISYKNGVSVEIQNTDAEGRLILADALIEASRSKPDAIVDLATLTGACVVALGENIAAAMSNNDDFRTQVVDIATLAGERVWPMPLPEDYRKLIDSPIADVANAGPRYGGSLTAGLFLKEFVDVDKWVHLDIAGPAFLKKTDGENIEGGTGFGVRTLVKLAESFV